MSAHRGARGRGNGCAVKGAWCYANLLTASHPMGHAWVGGMQVFLASIEAVDDFKEENSVGSIETASRTRSGYFQRAPLGVDLKSLLDTVRNPEVTLKEKAKALVQSEYWTVFESTFLPRTMVRCVLFSLVLAIVRTSLVLQENQLLCGCYIRKTFLKVHIAHEYTVNLRIPFAHPYVNEVVSKTYK